MRSTELRVLIGAIAFNAVSARSGASAHVTLDQFAANMAGRAVIADCMNGTPLPPAEVAEARNPARTTMQLYWARAAASDHADVRNLFHPVGRVSWTSGDQSRNYASLAQLNDPLARPTDATMIPEPIAFVRGRQGPTALGVWKVTSGSQIGYYLAQFRRRDEVWKLSHIEALPPGAAMPEISQYCARPGDVEQARVEDAERRARRDARRQARMQAQGVVPPRP